MLYEDIREFYETRREPGVSIRQEIVGTAIFKADVVSGIMVVLCNFVCEGEFDRPAVGGST